MIESVEWTFRGPDGDKVAATFTVVVSNTGNARRDEETSLMVSIDGADAESVAEVPALDAGASSPLLFNLRLDPGRPQIRVQIDESVSIVAMEILASDVVLAPASYQVVADGMVNFSVNVTNNGTVPTGPVSVVANSKVVGTVRPLQGGETDSLTFGLPLETGSHVVNVSAAPDAREVDTLNNDAVFNVEVDYVALVIDALSQSTSSFSRDGSATVELGFRVQNLGVAPSGDFTVAFECQNDPDSHCAGSTIVTSLLPGGEFEGVINAKLPQGTVSLQLYAGELEDDYRYGRENVEAVTVEVPIQPPVDLQFGVDTEITGYYSDGSAAVTISATLVNDGRNPVTDLRDVLISCRQGGQVVSGCGEVLELELEDGYGPVSADVQFKVPTGEISLVLDGGDVNDVANISIPERIVFLDRETWDCFADTSWNAAFPRGNCSGRSNDRIEKWENDKLIKLRATGNASYIEVLEDVLAEVMPEIGARYDWVGTEEEADVVAHVGLTQEEARSAGFVECNGLWGCSNITVDVDGTVSSGEIVVLVNSEEPYASLGRTTDVVEYSLAHHLVRVFAPMGYRNVPDSVMSIDTGIRRPELSASDKDLIRLTRHSLVEPGASVDDIRELVVFQEDLVDEPADPALTNLDLVRNARTRLHNANTALYELNGSWSGGQCDARRSTFGPSQVVYGSFGVNRSHAYHMLTEDERWLHLVSTDGQSSEYWDGSGRRWRKEVRDEQDAITSTSWSPEYSDPLVILMSILWFGLESQINIVRSDDAERVISVDLNSGFAAPAWASRNRLDIESIAIDLETYVVQSFVADWEFAVRGLACSHYHVEATLVSGGYGARLEIPDDVREDSDVLDE